MSKLLYIPRPLPEESPTSILKRMAIMHGCILRSDFRSLFGQAYFNGSLISRSHPIVKNIFRQAGIAGDEFLEGFYEPTGKLHHAPPLKIAGISVSADMIRKRGAAYCSECWKNGIEYFIKDLKLSSYCPYHFRKYLSKCPNCQSRLYWHGMNERCRCHHLLVSPPCSVDVAANEEKLLDIFRAGDAQKFAKLCNYLNNLGYRVERDTECPANRCLLTIALAILEEDMAKVLTNLKYLQILYPETPAFIIAAKLSLFFDANVRACARDFIKSTSREQAEERESFTTPPLHSFSLTKQQISAWLGIRQHYWKILRLAISIKPDKSRYTWQQALTVSKQVLIIKLRNGFSKKKAKNSISPPKHIQEQLQLSAAAIKGAIELHLLTPKWAKNHKMYFEPHAIEIFSKNFISVKLFSSQTKTPTKEIRSAIAHLKIAPLNLENGTLRRRLISTQSSMLITEWCKKNKKTQGRKRIKNSTTLLPCSPTGEKMWLSTAEAAEYLETWEGPVCHFVKHGLLTKVKKSRNGCGHLIDAKELKAFKAQFVSSKEARNLLSCSNEKVVKALNNFGVSPVFGPKIDHNPANFYAREQILLRNSTETKALNETSNGYTIQQAAEKLHNPTRTILQLIKIGALQLSDYRSANPFITCNSVDSFYNHFATSLTVSQWLKTRPAFVSKIMNSLNIYHLNGMPTDNPLYFIYAIEDIAKYFSIPKHHPLHKPGQKPSTALIKTSDLWEKYDISGKSFGEMFLSSGFVNPIRIGATNYLLPNEAAKVEGILERYYTFSQADRYLGHKHTRNLKKANLLIVVYPLKPSANYPMIEKVQVQAYAAKHGFA
ncbi:TniQ family protein [Pseudomonas sp. Irchel 3A7]|uniref:TniQ family protein n=1 Tax=Pseudomonas sp. Irchel 3A7 TaxID=2008913 RepID=UPI001481EFCE|nr:TniQ family protein [Pseudomonas sp. Irchel 3A7]